MGIESASNYGFRADMEAQPQNIVLNGENDEPIRNSALDPPALCDWMFPERSKLA
jgi:hypothetical protein